ncbi:hypothetical protein [Halorubrum tebenquichense]|uniref:VanZ family protein n=1 Tax=Halorubrum tebenquichense DSM 14210 TaxID=1227485 RepID=M0DL71_9EURY|nr:hypothetical protein [Halorubrum tebenquichense]ELZ35533.1 hypothetical protein C472_12021 [Halorubrum tebenquichense DSM 14210]
MSSADAGRSADRWGGAWRPFLAGTAVVLVASVLPVPDALVGPGGGVGGGGAPVGPLAALGPTAAFHLIGYAALAALATRATGFGRGDAREDGLPETGAVGGAARAASASTAVGFCVELLQAPLAWRSFAWVDAGVNAVGAVVGVMVVAAVAVLRRAAG